MKRYLFLAATIILLCSMWNPLTGSDQAGEKKTAELAVSCEYYPLKIGNTWEYQSGGKRIVVKVTAIESINGMDCARLETGTDQGPVAEYLTVKTDGVYRVRVNDKDVKPPLLLLAPKKGESWTVDSMVKNFALKGKLAVSEEKLTVDKTTYDALSVKSSDFTMGEQSAAIESWYAKDVGMVKQHLRLPGADLDIVLELVKFTPGK